MRHCRELGDSAENMMKYCREQRAEMQRTRTNAENKEEWQRSRIECREYGELLQRTRQEKAETREGETTDNKERECREQR